MIGIVAAITARLADLPWTFYDSDATGASGYPYGLILPSAGGLHPERTLAGSSAAISDEILVRAVALSANGVRGVLARTREVLTHAGGPLTFDTDDWRVTLTRQPGPVPIIPDRDVTLTGAGHPLFATDFYDLAAEPL